jgi:ABC-type Fe3+ transport system permease subunit
MQAWRMRAQLRRRARRRYLAVVQRRWQMAGAPRVYGRRSQVLLTLAWLAVPGVVAGLGLLMLSQTSSGGQPSLGSPALLLAVPLLVVWLLRGLTRL